MKLSTVVMLVLLNTGCIMPPRLGARYHRFERHGIEYVTCTVVAQADRPQLAAAALQLCKDAVEEHPAPEVGTRGKLQQEPK